MRVWTQPSDGSPATWEETGSPSPVADIEVPFDAPGLLAGIPFFTPSPGLTVMYYAGGYQDVPVPFDGNTPSLHVGYPDDLDALDGVLGFNQNLTTGNTPLGDHAEQLIANGSNCVRFKDATPVVVSVDDGSGGDPGATQGRVSLHLLGFPQRT